MSRVIAIVSPRTWRRVGLVLSSVESPTPLVAPVVPHFPPPGKNRFAFGIVVAVSSASQLTAITRMDEGARRKIIVAVRLSNTNLVAPRPHKQILSQTALPSFCGCGLRCCCCEGARARTSLPARQRGCSGGGGRFITGDAPKLTVRRLGKEEAVVAEAPARRVELRPARVVGLRCERIAIVAAEVFARLFCTLELASILFEGPLACLWWVITVAHVSITEVA